MIVSASERLFVLELAERFVQAEESKARSLEKLASLATELPEAIFDVAAAIEIANDSQTNP